MKRIIPFLPRVTSLDSFIAGFELAWRLSAEVHNDENERSFSCRTRRAGARFVSEVASGERAE